MAPFLKQARKLGVRAFQACKRRERIGEPTEIALAYSEQVEDIAVLGHFGAQLDGGR
jgi:hypothetical protein